MKILHISDIHHRSATNTDQNIVLTTFLNHLRANQSEFQNIDIVVVSGDLVYSGASEADFSAMKKAIIKPISEVLQLSLDRFLFCPGNHDIDRKVVDDEQYIEDGLAVSLRDRSSLNAFIDKNAYFSPGQTPPAFKRLSSFFTQIWAEDGYSDDRISPFFQTRRLLINDCNVGVACFNTAWRSTGKGNNADYGRLLLGERAVDLAIERINDCDLKLAVYHHPLDWLQGFDRQAVEGRLLSDFDILFCGHIHDGIPEKRQSVRGEAILSQAGCLYASRDWFCGYSVIEVDFTARQAAFRLDEYMDQRRVFRPAERISDNGRFVAQLPDRNGLTGPTFASIVRSARHKVRRLALDHINLAGLDDDEIDFERHYVCPPLSERSQASSEVGDETSDLEDSSISVGDVLARTEPTVIIGRPQEGKTSIGHYIAHQCIVSGADTARLPIIANFQNLSAGKVSAWKTALWPLLKGYATEILDATISRSTIESFQLLVVIDDVDIFDEKRVAMLNKLVAEYPNIRWILLARSDVISLSNEAATKKALPGFRTLSMRELSRRAIRELSAGWINRSTEDEITASLHNNVMDHIRRTGLPRTGYVVSLLIWVLRNRSQGELLNEAVLLQNLLDYVLGRMDYSGALRSEFDFVSKTSVLQEIAYWFKNSGDANSRNDVVQFVIDFLKKRSLDYDASKIVDGFVKCGVLEDLDGRVSFKFRRYRDFFVAGYLRDNDSVLQDIIDTSDKWLIYAREIDIFTSRYRNDRRLIEAAARELEKIELSPLSFNGYTVDEYLQAGPPASYTSRQLKRMRNTRMTAKQIDELLDRAERRAVVTSKTESRRDSVGSQRELRAADLNQNALFAELLRVYSQVIRNLEFIEGVDKQVHMRKCIRAWSDLAMRWIEVFHQAFDGLGDDIAEELSLNDAQKELVPEIVGLIETLIKAVLPSILSQYAYHSLGSEKIVGLVSDVASADDSTKMERFFAVSVLLELNPRKALETIRSFGRFKDLDNWTIGAVSQKLYNYYHSKPLPERLAREFEDVVAELEMAVAGASNTKGAVKSKILIELKKNQFKEDET